MKLVKIEKGSERWFGITIILLSAMLILTSLGRTEWIMYISGAFSALLGVIIYTEAGIREWLKKKGYKSVDPQDFLILTSFVFGTFLIVNAIMIFLGDIATGWFFDFIRGSGLIGGTISGILGIFLVLTKRPKA